jgi:hypothetical protein
MLTGQEEEWSSYRIGATFKNARANATRCFSPPLNWMEKIPHY